MSMFPGPHSNIYYNEEGEPIGWDTNYPDDHDFYDNYDNYNHDMDDMFDASIELMVDRGHGNDDALFVFWKEHPDLSLQGAYEAWSKENQ